MWTREQVKAKAKSALSLNYWKVILVTFLLSVVVGGTTGINIELPEFGSSFGGSSFEEDMYFDEDAFSEEDAYYEEEFLDREDLQLFRLLFPEFDGVMEFVVGFIVGLVVVILVIALIATIVSFVYSAFIGNPFTVGANRFFMKSLKDKAQVGEIGYGFDTNYGNVVKVMFLKSLYVFLWSLLFVIPGIIKAYEYYMVPYLLAENPNMEAKEALQRSKEMMYGNKWDTFVLELSFIGWDILSGMTIGILSVLYVNPYKQLTYAALYEALKEKQQYGYTYTNDEI